MIDRTTFDLRLAEHQATMARIEVRGWQHQGGTPRQPARTALAAAMAALGARLDRAARVAAQVTNRQPGHDAA